jgi:hypothetical protein
MNNRLLKAASGSSLASGNLNVAEALHLGGLGGGFAGDTMLSGR